MNELTLKLSSNDGILKSQFSDWLFLIGLPIFAIACSLFIFNYPAYKELVITLNLLLFGYHHVVATYSRIGFDWESIKTHKFFVFVLPFIVLVSVYGAFHLGGFALVSSIYLYWQWYHYTRQSEGVSKAYGMKSREKTIFNQPLHRFLFYAVPILSLVLMITRQNQMFFGSNFYNFNLPDSGRMFVGVLLTFVTVMGVIKTYLDVRNKRVTVFYASYFLGHYLIYLVAYVFVTEITSGWLAINIWHNIQYITIVHLYNSNKFKSGIDKKHFVISYLSQSKRLPLYLLVFVVLAFMFYGLIDLIISSLGASTSLPLLLIFYSAINFHHYIVDSQIWKLRKKSVNKHIVNKT